MNPYTSGTPGGGGGVDAINAGAGLTKTGSTVVNLSVDFAVVAAAEDLDMVTALATAAAGTATAANATATAANATATAANATATAANATATAANTTAVAAKTVTDLLPTPSNGTANYAVTVNAAGDGFDAVEFPTGGLPVATQAEAEAGSQNNKTMTPLRTAQAIAAQAGDAQTGAILYAHNALT